MSWQSFDKLPRQNRDGFNATKSPTRPAVGRWLNLSEHRWVSLSERHSFVPQESPFWPWQTPRDPLSATRVHRGEKLDPRGMRVLPPESNREPAVWRLQRWPTRASMPGTILGLLLKQEADHGSRRGVFLPLCDVQRP